MNSDASKPKGESGGETERTTCQQRAVRRPRLAVIFRKSWERIPCRRVRRTGWTATRGPRCAAAVGRLHVDEFRRIGATRFVPCTHADASRFSQRSSTIDRGSAPARGAPGPSSSSTARRGKACRPMSSPRRSIQVARSLSRDRDVVGLARMRPNRRRLTHRRSMVWLRLGRFTGASAAICCLRARPFAVRYGVTRGGATNGRHRPWRTKDGTHWHAACFAATVCAGAQQVPDRRQSMPRR